MKNPRYSAQFKYPTGVAADSTGNVFVADNNNSTVRKVTPSGVVTTLAGLTGSYGTANGTGSAARFSQPQGVAVNSAGNVVLTEMGNSAIRTVTSGGVVSTLTGLRWPGSGIDKDTAGNLYVFSAGAVLEITPSNTVTTLAGSLTWYGSVDGTGSAARFSTDTAGIAVDTAGNIYVTDVWNYTIRKVTPAGVVTTLAGLSGSSGSTDGTGSAARFYSAYGIAVDTSGNLYVADTRNYTIRKVTPAGVVTTLAGLAGSKGNVDGIGSAARFNYPMDVAVDNAGFVYVADLYTIRKVTPDGMVTTLGGLPGSIGSADGTGSTARSNFPFALSLDHAGNLYVADTYNDTIRKGWPASNGFSPVFITQPLSQTVQSGSDVSFAVSAVSSILLKYQWQFNGQNIAGATNTMLTLNSVGAGNVPLQPECPFFGTELRYFS